MRLFGLAIAAALVVLLPMSALAATHDSDVTIDGKLYVWDEEIVVGDTTAVVPYFWFDQQNNHVVYVRQKVSTGGSNVPYAGFVFSNNQTGTMNNIAQLMFVNEAIGGNEKRVAQILVKTGGATDDGMMIFRTFDSGVGKDALTLYRTGNARFSNEISATVVEVRGADMAELFDVRAEEAAPQPGMVVSIDAEKPGALTVSSKSYDRTVAGIIAGAGDLKTGVLMGQKGTLAYGDYPVVLSGRAYCYVDATKAPVQPGDLLTTSEVPGHAMKVTDHEKAQGAIIGKAMTPLNSGRGLVMVLVSLQ